MEDKITEKVYCYDHPSAYRQDNSAMWAALMSNRDHASDYAMLNNGWNNNPFLYMLFLMFTRGAWGEGGGDNYNSRAIAALQDSVNNNHNNDMVLQAIGGNANAIGNLASTFGTSFNQMQQMVCGVKSAIENVGGQVGFSAERVINAAILGDKDIQAKLAECCCNTQQNILKMGYENQLQLCKDHGSVMSRIDQLANGVTQGFASLGFLTEKNINAVLQGQKDQTQVILSALSNHWTQDLRDRLFEMSQQAQTASIVNQLRPTT